MRRRARRRRASRRRASRETFHGSSTIRRRTRRRCDVARLRNDQVGERYHGARGHAEPRNRLLSEARHQRKFAAGVGPRRQWKKSWLFSGLIHHDRKWSLRTAAGAWGLSDQSALIASGLGDLVDERPLDVVLAQLARAAVPAAAGDGHGQALVEDATRHGTAREGEQAPGLLALGIDVVFVPVQASKSPRCAGSTTWGPSPRRIQSSRPRSPPRRWRVPSRAGNTGRRARRTSTLRASESTPGSRARRPRPGRAARHASPSNSQRSSSSWRSAA